MTNDEIICAGSALSNKIVTFICEEVRKNKFQCMGDRDGVILCALIRVVVSKIIHRSENQEDADQVFRDFLKALSESYEGISFSDFDRSVH
jgi:hypothetical protein